MPAAAVNPDQRAPAGPEARLRRTHVPSEFVGLARDLIRRIGTVCPEAEARRSALIAPFRPRPGFKIFMPKVRRIVLARLASRLRTQPNLCRLRIVVRHAGGRLRCNELWATAAWFEHDRWAEREPALALLARKIEIGPPGFTEASWRIAGVGLHALARRFERGADRSDVAVLADLAALSEGYAAAARAGGEFEIPVPRGGRWIGAIGPGDAVAIVRTFVDR